MQNLEIAVRRPSLRPYKVSAVATILAAIFLAGCTRSSFLGRQFDDLTARYNTFYNAKRTFKEQEKRLEKQDRKVDMDRYLLAYEVPEASGRSAEFEKVIEKSADLLRKHPHSKWVDDALMLIGKSYFYQANYVGAEQKFTEVLALEGPLFEESAFWLARTLVASQSAQAAEDVIRTALSSERLDKKWSPQLYLLLGDLRAESGDWHGSIEAVELGLEDIRDGDIAARAQFLLGQLYETIEDYPAAIAAYREVQKFKPLYELSFAALYSQYRVEGVHGDSEVALAGLQKMQRDNKHFQYLDRIEYNRARVYAAAGDAIAAQRLFQLILYPPPGRKATSIRGEVHYRAAEMYRDLIGDFNKSAAHFDTASSALRTTSVDNVPYTPDAITNAAVIADVFETYREVLEEVHEMDSLLYLGGLDDEAFAEAVQKVREQLGREAERIAEELERRQTQSSFQRDVSPESGTPNRSTTTGSQQQQRFGFLNHKDIQLVQEAFLNFRRIWGDRPLIPGWRREEVILSTRSNQQNELDKVDGSIQGQLVTGSRISFLPPVDVSEVPRDSISQASMRSLRAAARYRLANVLFLSMSLPDSARYWYRLVVEQDNLEPVSLRAQYALAEVDVAVGNQASANEAFQRIIEEYPESVFADRARVSLGIEIASETTDADSLQISLNQYTAAYEHWNRGVLRSALDGMIRTAADHPRSEVAAKALLAAGAIFSEMAQTDSVDLFGVIPIGDSVFTEAEISLARIVLETDSVVEHTDSLSAADVLSAANPLKPEPEVLPGNEIGGRRLDQMPPKGAVLDAAQTDVPAVNEAQADEPLAVESSVPIDTLTVDSTLAEQAAVPPSGELLDLEEDGLRLKTDRRQQYLDDEELIAKSMDDDASNIAKKGQVPVNESVESDAPSDTTSADTSGALVVEEVGEIDEPQKRDQPLQPAPPQKPEWIQPEYFVNTIVPQPMTLYALFASVETNFSGTEYGDRASSLKRGLIAHREELYAPPDTTTTAVTPATLGSALNADPPDKSLVKLDR